MIALARALRRDYAAYDVVIEVHADDPQVIEAMDLRLRGFSGGVDQSAPRLRLVFDSAVPAAPAPEAGRAVYETRYGTLYYFPEQELLAGELGGVALHCEPRTGRAVIAASAFRERSLYFATHPVATVALMELMERLGRFSLHAACLSDTDGHGLLLCGPSGAGKSTLTLALVQAGLEFLGDDVVFLQRQETRGTGIRALGFADALGIGPFAAARFPELSKAVSQAPEPGFPKRLGRFEELFGRASASTCVPRVIVFAEVEPERRSAVAALDRGEALVRLVPDVLITNPDASREHVAVIGELLTQVHCYTVRSGYDLEHAAELVRALL